MTTIAIPEELKNKKCVLKDSIYGKLFLKYQEMKKPYCEINEKFKNTEFGKITKYDFLINFLLNKSYSLNDFLYIPNHSLRGFIYETIWDICFKCNVVAGYEHYQHMQGKIEDMRIIKTEIKEKYANMLEQSTSNEDTQRIKTNMKAEIEQIFKNQTTNLKPLKNLYNYFTKSKVQSGNISGISDITLKTSDKNFVFISSKYYKHEKLISEYDVSAIAHATKDLRLNYKVILLVKNKTSILQKIKRTQKKHIVQDIIDIFDTTDLETCLNRLRDKFDLYSDVDDVLKTNKQVINFSYEHNIYLRSVSQYTDNNPIIWNTTFDKLLRESILLYLIKFKHEKVHIICQKQNTFYFKLTMLHSYGFAPDNCIFANSVANHMKTVFVFVQSSLDYDKHKETMHNNNIDRYIIIYNDYLPCKYTHTVQFGIKDIQLIDLSSKILIKQYPEINLIDNHLHEYPKSKTINSYQKMFDNLEKEKDKCFANDENIQKVLDYVLSSKVDINEPFIVFNRIHEPFKKHTILWIMSKETIIKFTNVIKNNLFIKEHNYVSLMTSDINHLEISTHFEKNLIILTSKDDKMIYTPELNTIVLLDFTLSQNEICNIISHAFFKTYRKHLNIVTFSSNHEQYVNSLQS